MKINNFIKVITVTALIFIAGCSSSVQSKELSNSDLMMVAHCLEMEMPGCGEYENIKLTQEQINYLCDIMSNMEICKNSKEDIEGHEMMSKIPM